uniref:LRRCT domain-containing protein n=1 Tax=Heterorhabditis bacteriophora TaxID=37862 RepID=A0A1I7WD42_HETBA
MSSVHCRAKLAPLLVGIIYTSGHRESTKMFVKLADDSEEPSSVVDCLELGYFLMFNDYMNKFKNPCSCSSTRYEPLSIVCENGDSLNAVLLALRQSPRTTDCLTISNIPINQLPGYAFQRIHTKKLILKNNGLREIHPNAFDGTLTEILEELEIKGNFIESIPQNGLSRLKKLRALSLSDNLIEYVLNNSFLSYESRNIIQRLDLSSNKIRAIHSTGLLGLENLTQLYLDKNQFHNIPTEALLNIPTLQDLSLGVNFIKDIPPGSLPLPKLISLSLEVNYIRTIPADSLQSVPNLVYLYLGNNLLTSVDPSMFFYMRNLKVLSMGNNKDITSISYNCKLKSNCRFYIAHDTFSNLPELVSLDLSSNAITHVDDFALSQLTTLSSLDLSGNRLETLPNNVIYDSLLPKGPKHSRALYLHNNPWKCENNLAWLRKWLRQNGDVQISINGQNNARCWTPSYLSGFDLRQTDPVHSVEPVLTRELMRKFVKPSTNLFIPTRNEIPLDKTQENPRIEGVNLVALILGIVLGVLGVCLILLVIIRYIIKSDREKSVSNLGSSSLASGFGGSGYNGGPIVGSRPFRSSTNHNIISVNKIIIEEYFLAWLHISLRLMISNKM